MVRSKNAYFVHVANHRALQQVWNVDVIGFGRSISIWVQGGEMDGFARPTNFAKKHLLTYAGGSRDKSEGKVRDKIKKILITRQTPNVPADPKRAKYGGQIGHNIKNTLLLCDKFPANASDPDSLPQLFAQALNTPVTKPSAGELGHAFIEVVAEAVFEAFEEQNVLGQSHIEVKKPADSSRLYRLEFGFEQLKDKFQIVHLVGMHGV